MCQIQKSLRARRLLVRTDGQLGTPSSNLDVGLCDYLHFLVDV